MDIEHPDIRRIHRFGYHDPEAFDYEQRLLTEEIVEDSDEWPDGMSWGNWQKERGVNLGEMERTTHRNL